MKASKWFQTIYSSIVIDEENCECLHVCPRPIKIYSILRQCIFIVFHKVDKQMRPARLVENYGLKYWLDE